MITAEILLNDAVIESIRAGNDLTAKAKINKDLELNIIIKYTHDKTTKKERNS